jgi:hypothetical protein
MNAPSETIRRLDDTIDPEGKFCTQPGCDHPAYTSVWWAPGHFSGFACRCCLRRTLERRLAELTEELRRLPGGIDALPKRCEIESNP